MNHGGSGIICLPYFYILGQPKCGTTMLYELLSTHQDIVPPMRKEMMFWNSHMSEQNIQKYVKDFAQASEEIQRAVVKTDEFQNYHP